MSIFSRFCRKPSISAAQAVRLAVLVGSIVKSKSEQPELKKEIPKCKFNSRIRNNKPEKTNEQQTT